MNSNAIVSIIAAVGGVTGIASLAKVFVDRTQIRADAMDKIAGTSVKMLTPLHEEIDRLTAKLRRAEGEVDDLRRQMRTMAEHQEELGRIRNRLAEAEQEATDLRLQCRRLLEQIEDKDRELARKDRTIAALRAGQSD